MELTEFVLARLAEDEASDVAAKRTYLERVWAKAKTMDEPTYLAALLAVKVFAAKYADHPDFDPTWAV